MLEKVQVVILKKDNESYDTLLLQTNQKRGSFWQNITGGVELNDSSIHHAAQREIKEEIGLELEIQKIISLNQHFEYYDQNRDITYKEHFFVAIIPSKANITLSEEHINFKWVNTKFISLSNYKFESSFAALALALKVLGQDLTV